MPKKPQIRYDRENRKFLLDNRPISDEQALERWEAIDSDWTQGAYMEMAVRATNPQQA